MNFGIIPISTTGSTKQYSLISLIFSCFYAFSHLLLSMIFIDLVTAVIAATQTATYDI
jgi:hypothetical protein